jgi:hypothetical protein
MVLQDYYNQVIEDVPTAAALDPQSVYDAINRARRRVASETDAALALYTFNLIPGTWNYPYTATIVEGCSLIAVRKVWIYIGTVRYPLGPCGDGRSSKKFEYPYANFQSWPIKWWKSEGSIYYWPVPASNYTTDWICVKMPNTLSNIRDVDNDIPYQYFDATCLLANKYTAIKDGNLQLAAGFEELYQQAMAVLPRGDM